MACYVLLKIGAATMRRRREREAMKFEMTPLPYKKGALAPMLSEQAVEHHYDQHHKGYMSTLSGLLEGKAEASKSLEEIVKTSSGRIFNNAAQIWNHDLFWRSMHPRGGGAPGRGDLLDLINRDFGNWERFRAEFKAEGMNRFGSGWVWLVLDGGKGKIISTANAETPLTTLEKPLIACDVWEHAYYDDYRSKRDSFLESFLDKLVNWDFASKNLKA
jgi:Fe-Mn family superoxide dismutase